MTRRVALLAAVLGLGWSAMAAGQVTSEQPASIVVFPKLIVGGSRDAVIQLSNSGNAAIGVYCWYLDGALTFPDLPPGPINPPRWTVTDFQLVLTQKQPTSWVGSRGRAVDPLDNQCGEVGSVSDCYGAGVDPGDVPALAEGFEGALRCIETDLTGDPVSGNHLTGEATLIDTASGDVSKYSAIGLAGFEENDGDRILQLGTEYAGCPSQLRLDHATDGSELPAVGIGSQTVTELTLVPCTANLDTLDPDSVTVAYFVTTEFETTFSTAQPFTCWSNAELGETNPIFTAAVLGAATAQTRIRPAMTSGPGLLAVAEERRSAGGSGPPPARAAANLHIEGVRNTADVITLP